MDKNISSSVLLLLTVVAFSSVAMADAPPQGPQEPRDLQETTTRLDAAKGLAVDIATDLSPERGAQADHRTNQPVDPPDDQSPLIIILDGGGDNAAVTTNDDTHYYVCVNEELLYTQPPGVVA